MHGAHNTAHGSLAELKTKLLFYINIEGETDLEWGGGQADH